MATASPPEGLGKFLRMSRAQLVISGTTVRTVSRSEVVKKMGRDELHVYLADRAPFFYRDLKSINDSMGDGYFLTTVKETLQRLPNAKTFRMSHFGEIMAGLFAEEVVGYRKLYSKLSLLTSENANAFKMDLVMYEPGSSPMKFVFGEVKSSDKVGKSGKKPGHDKSCFADLFKSLAEYGQKDLEFDLGAIKDRLSEFEPDEAKKIRRALRPGGARVVTYAGFVVIDTGTFHGDEAHLLARRASSKNFEVDLVGVEGFPEVAQSMYLKLEAMRKACS